VEDVMKAGRLVLAAMALAGVALSAGAQGRGTVPPRQRVMSDEARRELTEMRARHQKEMQELRAKHREQIERVMPPEARERLEQRRRELIREGRMFERQRALRGRGGMDGPGMRGRGAVAPRAGMQFRRGPAGQGRGMIGPGRGMADPGRGMMGPGRGMMGPGRGMMGPGRGMMGPGRGMMGPGRGVS
jgi:hypothetical protein